MITVKGVSKSFGSVSALADVSFEAGTSETIAVVGPSGCGKSTLLDLVCRLAEPDAGSVEAAPAIGEGADTRQDDAVRPADRLRIGCDEDALVDPRLARGALHRLGGGVEIAGPVIDQRDAHRHRSASGNRPMTGSLRRANDAGAALDRRTDLVTLQIGGNDIGFGSIIATCAGLSVTDPAGDPCEQHYTAGGTDQLAANVLDTAPKVAEVLRAIHQRSPHARVVVVGYPDLLPDDGVGCFPSVPFAAGDFSYLRDTEKRLNGMLRVEALLLFMVASAASIIIIGALKTLASGGGYGELNLMVSNNSGLYEGSTISALFSFKSALPAPDLSRASLHS